MSQGSGIKALKLVLFVLTVGLFLSFSSPTPTASPTITAVAGNQQFTVSWSAVSGATGYNLYYQTGGSTSIATGTKLAGATSPLTVTGLTNKTPYTLLLTCIKNSTEVSLGTVSLEPSLIGGSVQLGPLNLAANVSHLAGFVPGLDGSLASATLASPQDITKVGSVYYVTDGNCIRKLDPVAGTLTTLAGIAGIEPEGRTDGTASAARFNYPIGITSDGTSLYVCDTGNNSIRQIR